MIDTKVLLKNILYWSLADFSVVFVSGVGQSGSVICLHTLTVFQISCHIGYYQALSRLPCAPQKVLMIHFIHTSVKSIFKLF